MKLDKYIDQNLKRVDKKTIIVTGANSGIGFLISKVLIKKGANVVMAIRNFKKGQAAINEIKQEFPKANIKLIHFDLDDLTSLDEFVDAVKSNYSDFDGLILNAGILGAHPEDVTKQGFPKVVGDNYLSLLYLLNKIKPYLDGRTKPCKVIFQGSLMSRRIKYHSGELNHTNSHNLHSYSVSKAGVENLFYDLASNNINKNVTYLLAEPGACKTNIYHNLPRWIIPAADAFMSIAFHSALKGSLTALNLMCNETSNGKILVPRGLGHFSGYPKQIKIPLKVLKNKLVLKEGKELISTFIK